MNEIVLPEDDPPRPIEAQLKGALYNASNYYEVTKITHQHRVGYLVPASTWERMHAPKEDDGLRYLIWSFKHSAWWRPAAAGYTEDVERAGRYPRDEAAAYVAISADCGNVSQVSCMVIDHSHLKNPEFGRDVGS